MHGAKEIGDLAQANLSIAGCEERIREQAALVEELRREGRDATEAEHAITAMQEQIEAWCEHRRLVLSAMAETD
jgi:hypothetical protein